jgi:TctA family transporter
MQGDLASYVLSIMRIRLGICSFGIVREDRGPVKDNVTLACALMTDGDLLLFLTRPTSGGMLALSVASVVLALWQHRRQHRAAPAEPDTDF